MNKYFNKSSTPQSGNSDRFFFFISFPMLELINTNCIKVLIYFKQSSRISKLLEDASSVKKSNFNSILPERKEETKLNNYLVMPSVN